MNLRVILFLMMLLIITGCGKEEKVPDTADYVTTDSLVTIINEGYRDIKLPVKKGNGHLTRQQLCGLISDMINNTESLRDKYIPVRRTVETGKESRYYKRLFNGLDSTEDPVLLQQMANSEKMVCMDELMKDGTVISYYIYSNDGGNSRFSNIISDYGKIAEEYKEAVSEACHIGYIDVFFDEGRHEILFKPEELVTYSEVKEIIESVIQGSGPEPIDCIKINYWEKDEFDDGNGSEYVNLCIGNVPALVVSKELDGLRDPGDRLYFTFGLDNVSLCLWYNCKAFGMLEMPACFPGGKQADIEFTVSDAVNRIARLKLSSFFIRSIYRESFISWATEKIENSMPASKTFGEINVSINVFDNRTGVISLKEAG